MILGDSELLTIIGNDRVTSKLSRDILSPMHLELHVPAESSLPTITTVSSQTAPPGPPHALTTSSKLSQPAIVSIDLLPSKQQSKVEDDLDTTGQQNNLPKDYEMDDITYTSTL